MPWRFKKRDPQVGFWDCTADVDRYDWSIENPLLGPGVMIRNRKFSDQYLAIHLDHDEFLERSDTNYITKKENTIQPTPDSVGTYSG